jgi:glycosyltransferase involved in cell wall biosynthesis
MLNEEANVPRLWGELREVSAGWGFSCEFVFVDDGSQDGTVAAMQKAVGGDARVTILCLARRFGQTAALGAGFRAARGNVIVPMDADLQNDPRDVPMLVAALDEGPGYDVVSGWRKNRKDNFVRRFPSRVANRIINKMTWMEIHDFGCTLKAYRREILEGMTLYGEMHRFLPALCQWRGGRITERVVNHRPRTAGKSKYGLIRTVKVMLDLTTVKFLGDYLTKPLYFFAKVAGATLLASVALLAVAGLQRFGYLYEHAPGLNMNRNILSYVSLTLFTVSIMFVMLGVIAELLVRIYHESAGLTPYRIRRVYREGAVASEAGDGGAKPAAGG